LYSSYTAAAFARKYELADHFGINFKGAVTWAFEFEDQPWFNGYRDLATNGIDKPVLNVFRMFGMMTGDRVEVTGDIAYKVMAARDYRIDQENSNSYEAWKKMGSPQAVSNEQYATLEQSSRLKLIEGPKNMNVENEELVISTPLEGQAVSLFVIEW